ncbi:10308_t:CDS:2 [Paraglomus occultum]|uniref:10308_t:CDS:1 n=1 Tax=Paraglomus occultum TaxID=144539 RepID=A0A9N8Z079_9GLOM|nr:10308_t:CDS:2 [Paraglomus occultum]
MSRAIGQYGRQNPSPRNWLMASLDRYNHKKAFIQEQIRIFKQPFKPSSKWLTPKKHKDREGDEDDDNAIPPSVINSVVVRLNTANKKQYLQTFSHQSVRQLLEQLQSLYDQKRRDALLGRIRVERLEDFDSLSWIDSFPSQWPIDEGYEYEQSKLERYATLRSQVCKLVKDYIKMKQRYENYKSLNDLVAPLNKRNIQQNLITRNAPIVNEITRMRIFVPRLLNTLQKHEEYLRRKRARKSEKRGSEQDISTMAVVKGLFNSRE